VGSFCSDKSKLIVYEFHKMVAYFGLSCGFFFFFFFLLATVRTGYWQLNLESHTVLLVSGNKLSIIERSNRFSEACTVVLMLLFLHKHFVNFAVAIYFRGVTC